MCFETLTIGTVKQKAIEKGQPGISVVLTEHPGGGRNIFEGYYEEKITPIRGKAQFDNILY